MIPVISVENMRKSDRATIDGGVSGRELMWRAAQGVYNSVAWHGKIAIVCGSGNNAGDGYALALILKQNGFLPDIILLRERFSADGEYYFKKCKGEGICVDFWHKSSALDGYDIVVDCILGTGFSGELSDELVCAIEKINASGAYVVSVDINSGLNGDSGLCKTAVKSDLTVSIGTPKHGHYLNQAKDYIRELKNVDIGIEIIDTPSFLIEEKDCKRALKPRKEFSHKGAYGYATLIGGCTEYSGAIRLANMALSAMRSGAGVIRVATAKSISHAVMPHLLEATLYPLDDIDGAICFNKEQIDGALLGAKALAIGMGIGQRAQAYEIIDYVLSSYEIPVVIDADGLNALSRGDKSILKKTKCTVILTPHPAELARLLGISTSEVVADPIGSATKLAKEYGVIVLLKGATTIVASAEAIYLVNRGCAGMATAGSGDVLSGILLALCAQSPEPEAQLINTYAGAYINGLAGELAQAEHGAISMLSTDTISKISSAIMKIAENE